jgi:hypothetical protein
MSRKNLTEKRLRELLFYDQETGLWTWIVRRGKRGAGALAGSIDHDGYLQIMISGVRYGAHNLAFLWMIGRWPDPTCDHKDLVKANNRWSNLREATKSEQIANQSLTKKNTSGLKWVRFDKRVQRWRAETTIRGKYIWLGHFDDRETAYAIACSVVKKAFGEFARTE